MSASEGAEVPMVRPGVWHVLLGRVRERFARGRRLRALQPARQGRMWVMVGVAFVTVAALGVIGFTRYQQSQGALEPITSRIYQSIQLFVLEGGAVAGPAPWELELARLAAPLVAAYAVVQALAAIFREQVESLRLRFVTGHVVVAGLGGKGRLIARALLESGRRVVAIEVDAANREIAGLRASGGLVVVGDARRPDTLRRARLDRASQLVVLCGQDVVNAEIVAAARAIAGERRTGFLHCVAHLIDPELCLLLTGQELERYGTAPIRVDFVNVYAAAAQAVLRAHPPFPEGNGAGSRVAIFGAGSTARHLIVALARAWSTGMERVDLRLPVSVTGADPSVVADLADRHPEIARFLDLQPAGETASALAGSAPGVVYICPDDDASAVTATLRLRSQLAGRASRLVTVLAQRAGLAQLLDGAPQPPGGPSLATFGLLDEACRPDLLLMGTTELLAQALHRAYLDEHGRDGAAGGAMAADSDPTLRPWPQLPEHLRESNRDQAAHVAVKLAAIGAVIGPLVDWERAETPFTPGEVEAMGRLEHDRWMTERLAAGWRPGPRDPARRTTPYLVSWEELSEEIRDRDRMFIRQLPRLLASVGLQALRPDSPVMPTAGAAIRANLPVGAGGSP